MGTQGWRPHRVVSDVLAKQDARLVRRNSLNQGGLHSMRQRWGDLAWYPAKSEQRVHLKSKLRLTARMEFFRAD